MGTQSLIGQTTKLIKTVYNLSTSVNPDPDLKSSVDAEVEYEKAWALDGSPERYLGLGANLMNDMSSSFFSVDCAHFIMPVLYNSSLAFSLNACPIHATVTRSRGPRNPKIFLKVSESSSKRVMVETFFVSLYRSYRYEYSYSNCDVFEMIRVILSMYMGNL